MIKHKGEDLIVKDGIFYCLTNEKIIEIFKKQFPNKNIVVHTIFPGEAHITIYPK